MKNILTLLFSSIALAACTSSPSIEQEAASYNPQTQARIRLFGQNQKPSIITYTENHKTKKVNIGGGLGDAFSSLTGTIKNQTLGIPETNTTRQLSELNGILSHAFFREIIVPAGSPVNIKTAYIGLTNSLDNGNGSMTITKEASCQSPTITFIPEAGHDYEAVVTKNRCNVTILNVDSSGNLTAIKKP